MANFNLFIPKLLKSEVGYAFVKNDKGGETYRGIARKSWPTWIGWKAVDAKKAKAPIKHNTVFPELETLVKSFYKTFFWDKINADAIVSQSVAEFYCDFFVNSGANAHRKMNETLKELGVSAINKANPERLMQIFVQKRINFVNAIVNKNPTQAKFLDGWMARIQKYAKDIPVTAVAVSGVGISLALIGGFFLLNSKYKWIKT